MKKRAWQDSNLRPLVPETNTLSSELQARKLDYIRNFRSVKPPAIPEEGSPETQGKLHIDL